MIDRLFQLSWRRVLVIAGVWVLSIVLHNAVYALFFDYFSRTGGDEPVFFMLAVIAGFPETGLLLVAGWTVICFVFHGIRLAQAFASRQPVTSWMDR